jgi:Cu/Ag efflux protein CusF
MNRGLIASIAFGLSAAAVARTPAADPPAPLPGIASAADAAQAMSDGEVRKVDREQAKVTLRHGPIGNLGMPAMTMVFKVADVKALDTFRAGDKVRFVAARVAGAITITEIEVAK